MTVHMLKLCVGAESIEDLENWQRERVAARRKSGEQPLLFHATRMVPKRRSELVEGGSLYWVIKGFIQVRQQITGLSSGAKADGTPCCLIHLEPRLVPVRPQPKRPFQGWRYLAAEEAPADLAADSKLALSAMPQRMRRELAELGLL